MAKTYKTTAVFKDAGGEAMSFTNDPIAYQQAHSHHDIHTVNEINGDTTEIFIPWGAVAYFEFTVREFDPTAPTDAFCVPGGKVD